MSIVGTRPPLPNEWEAYELHHRAISGFIVGLDEKSRDINDKVVCDKNGKKKWNKKVVSGIALLQNLHTFNRKYSSALQILGHLVPAI